MATSAVSVTDAGNSADTETQAVDATVDAGGSRFITKTEVRQLLQTGELKLVDNVKDGIRNQKLWNNFQLVVKNDGESTEYVCCKKCRDVFKHNNQKSGTSHLKNHMDGGKCTKVDKQQNIQTSMTAFLATSGHQKHAKAIARRSLLNFCVMDIKPFSTSDGQGFRSFGQAMLDIGAKIGGKMKIEDILPDRRTISNDA